MYYSYNSAARGSVIQWEGSSRRLSAPRPDRNRSEWMAGALALSVTYRAEGIALKSIEIQERLDQANEDYYTLKLRFDELQENTSRSGSPIITYGSETEKYKGEIIDATLDGLKLLLDSTIAKQKNI